MEQLTKLKKKKLQTIDNFYQIIILNKKLHDIIENIFNTIM